MVDAESGEKVRVGGKGRLEVVDRAGEMVIGRAEEDDGVGEFFFQVCQGGGYFLCIFLSSEGVCELVLPAFCGEIGGERRMCCVSTLPYAFEICLGDQVWVFPS